MELARDSPQVSNKDVRSYVSRYAKYHVSTLTPATTSAIGILYCIFFEPTGLAVGAAFFGLLVAIGSWAYHYLIKGEKHAETYVARQLARWRRSRLASIDQVIDGFRASRFEKGFKEAYELKQAYDDLITFLSGESARNVPQKEQLRSLAEETLLEGVEILQAIANIRDAVAKTDVAALRREVRDWDKQAQALEAKTSTQERAKPIRAMIESNSQRIELYEKADANIASLFALAEACEATLAGTYQQFTGVEASKFLSGAWQNTSMERLKLMMYAAQRKEQRAREAAEMEEMYRTLGETK